MPRLSLATPNIRQSLPASALLADDEHGFFYDLGMGLLEGLDYITSDFLVNLAAGKLAIPFKGTSFDFWGEDFGTETERLENWRDVITKQWGFKGGAALNETEGRAGQAALWGGAGLAVGGPIGALILGGLGAVVPPPEDAAGLIGTGMDIISDPFVWSKFAKLGKVVQNPVYRAAKAKFTPQGWNEFLKMRKLPSVKKIAKDFGDEAAVYRAEEMVLEPFRHSADDVTETLLKNAEKAGLLDRGGWKIGVPWMGELYGAKTVPGTPELFETIGKVAAPLVGPVVKPIKKALNIFDPVMEDVKYVSSAAFRHTSHRAKIAVQNVQDAVNEAVTKKGLPEAFTMDTLTKVQQSAGALGLDEALKRLAPGLPGRHRDTVMDLVSMWNREFEGALKFIESKGGHVDQLDLALRRAKIARENVLAKAINDQKKFLQKDTGAELKTIDGKLNTLHAQKDEVGQRYYRRRSDVYRRLVRDEGKLAYKGFKSPKTRGLRGTLEEEVGEDIAKLARKEAEELARFDQKIELLEMQATEMKIVSEIRQQLADSGLDVGLTPKAQAAKKAAAKETAQVPTMITKKMRLRLMDKGYTDDQIRKMTPAEAWKNLKVKKPTRIEPVDTDALRLAHKQSAEERTQMMKLLGFARTEADDLLAEVKAMGSVGARAIGTLLHSQKLPFTAEGLMQVNWDTALAKQMLSGLGGPEASAGFRDSLKSFLARRNQIFEAEGRVSQAAKRVADETVAGVQDTLRGQAVVEEAVRIPSTKVDPRKSPLAGRLGTMDPNLEGALATGEVQLKQLRDRLQQEIVALGKAMKESPSYAPRYSSEEFKALGRALAADGGLYEKAVDTLTERLLKRGDVFTDVGGLRTKLNYPEIARSMVKNLVNRTLGSKGGGGKTSISTERALAVEIMVEGAEGTRVGTKLWRSLRPDELEPLVKEMETLIGESLFRYSKAGKALAGAGRVIGSPIKATTYPIRRHLYGREKAGSFLKLRTPKVFETDPVMQTVKYYEYLGQPIARATGYHRLIRDFGKKASKQDIAALHSGQLRGMDLIDDIKGLEGHLFPSRLVPEIRRWNKHWTSDESVQGVLAAFDAVQGWWKRQALISPAYHTRNFISGLWQGMHLGNIRSPTAYLEALNLQLSIGRFGVAKDKPLSFWRRLHLWKDEAIHTVNGDRITYKKLYEWAKEDGVLGPGFFEYESKLVGGYVKKGVRGGITELDRGLFKANAVAGQKVEETLRLAQYIDGLKKGMGRLQIAKEVGYTHFLYDQLGAIESRWAKRFFPFWSWSRFNIPRSLIASLQNPGRPAVVRHILEDLQGRDDMPTASLQPDWVRKAFGIRYEKRNGKDHYFFLGSWWPVADVAKLIAYPVATFQDLLTPAIKMPMEMYSGKRIGSDRSIEQFEGQKGQVYMPPGVGWMYGTGALGGNVAFDRSTMHMMRTFRVLNELDKLLGPAFQDVTPSKRESLETMQGRLFNMLLGARYYIQDRERAAGGVMFENRMKIGQMRSWYMRSVANNDGLNRDVAYNWLVERGISPPSDKEYRAFLKRHTRGLKQRKKEVRRTLQAVPAGGF